MLTMLVFYPCSSTVVQNLNQGCLMNKVHTTFLPFRLFMCRDTSCLCLVYVPVLEEAQRVKFCMNFVHQCGGGK